MKDLSKVAMDEFGEFASLLATTCQHPLDAIVCEDMTYEVTDGDGRSHIHFAGSATCSDCGEQLSGEELDEALIYAGIYDRTDNYRD